MQNIKEKADEIIAEASKIIVGKEIKLRLVVMSIFCGGHILIDDLPGVGKTTLIKVISKLLGCSFSRVQFTPDLLPSDIIGTRIFNQKTSEFEILHGPVMTNIFLADEINRAIPRTQSALLEAMEEIQVTIDSKTYPLPLPFIVMATQNPVEMESTFNLPLAQMDRFLTRISLGYPSHDDEIQMLKTVGDEIPFDRLSTLLSSEEIMKIQNQIKDVYISDSVLSYIVSLVEATRSHSLLKLPISPRGSRAIYRAGKAWAAMNGRDFLTPDDVKELAPHILSHRLAVNNEARLALKKESDIILEILDSVAAPGQKEDVLRAK